MQILCNNTNQISRKSDNIKNYNGKMAAILNPIYLLMSGSKKNGTNSSFKVKGVKIPKSLGVKNIAKIPSWSKIAT